MRRRIAEDLVEHLAELVDGDGAVAGLARVGDGEDVVNSLVERAARCGPFGQMLVGGLVEFDVVDVEQRRDFAHCREELLELRIRDVRDVDVLVGAAETVEGLELVLRKDELAAVLAWKRSLGRLGGRGSG